VQTHLYYEMGNEKIALQVNILTCTYCNDIDIFFTGESINNPDPF